MTRAPTPRHATYKWAVGDRILLKAGVNAAFREGQAVRMIVKDTAALPDAVVEVVPGRVVRADDGRLMAVAEWVITGRPRRRQHELKLEFHAEGLGVRSPTGKVAVRPARLVQIEVGAGNEECGAVSLHADAAIYDVARGRATRDPEFAQGRRVEFEIPLDYKGVLAIVQGGRPLVRIDLARVPGQDTIKLKLASAGRQLDNPEPVTPLWNRPAPPPPRRVGGPTVGSPWGGGGVSGVPSLGGPAGSEDAPLLYVCEVDDAGPFEGLYDGRLYTTDRVSDARLKKVHDTVIGVTTEVLSAETLQALKVRSIKFTLTTHEGQRLLIVEANRATRRRFSQHEAAVRAKRIPGNAEFAENLTRGASAGARGIARRSFLALKGKGSWLGVLLVGAGEAAYNYAQGASLLQVLDVFGMTALKGALSMVLGTAAVGLAIAGLALVGITLTLTTGGLVVAAVVAGYFIGELLNGFIPDDTLSGLLDRIENTTETWLHEFDDSLRSFRQWAAAAGAP